MALDQIKAFVQKANSDEAIKEKLGKLPNNHAEAIKEVVKIANEAGYKFTEQDWYDAHKNLSNSSELSQEDLDKISGGTITVIIVTTITPPIVSATIQVCGK